MTNPRHERWGALYRSLNWTDLTRYWPTLERCAAGRNRKAVYRSTRNYNPHHHLIGVCGEFVYAVTAGIEMSFAVDDTRGDGAVDFSLEMHGQRMDVQVKAIPHYPSRWRRGTVALVEFPDAQDMAAYYVLTMVDIRRQRGTVIGWEHGGRLAHAPSVNFGYGPRLALRAVDLIPGLPRVEEMPANFLAWQAAGRLRAQVT